MAKVSDTASSTGTTTQISKVSPTKRKAAMATNKSTLYPSKIDFSDATRAKLVDLCNQRLADTSDLVSQVKQAHWNVKGPDFQQLHELFDAIHAALEPFVDVIAERATTLGGVALGTVRMAAKATSLKEYPDDIAAGKAHLEAVRDRVAAYAAANRQALEASGKLDDPTTEDMVTEISRTVDLQLYFLESHLQG